MRTRIIVGLALLFVVGVGTLGAGPTVGVDKQWTITNFRDPVLVKRVVISGPVAVVHDSEKMARGEACTTFYRFKPGVGIQEQLVSFHCQPRDTKMATDTTFTTVSTDAGCKKLVEYQIAGTAEAHGVPAQ
jgi:hypothetical protein